MATALRPIVIAYNNVAIAGDDAAYQIGQYRLARGRGKLTLSFDVLIVASTALGLQTAIDALDPLVGDDGNLVIQLGREITFEDLTGNGTTTVTSVTGGFLDAHVGLWLSIRGVTPKRITARANGTSITVHQSLATGTYRAILPARVFSGTHAANTFTNGRGDTEKVSGDDRNTELSQLFRVTVTGDIPPENDGLEDAVIDITWNEARHRIVDMRGTCVPFDFDSDGDVDDAYDVYVNLFDTGAGGLSFATNHLSAFGGVTAYELVNETGKYPASDAPSLYAAGALPAKKWEWTRRYRERFVADAAGIIAQAMEVILSTSTTHGQEGKQGKVTAEVAYSTFIDHDVVTHTGLFAYYRSTVRPLIRAAIRRQTGASSVVIETERPRFNETTNQISATLSCYLPDRSSGVLKYSSTETENTDLALDPAKLWDGIEHTYAIFPTGASRNKTVIITADTQRPIKFNKSGEIELGKVPKEQKLGLDLGFDLGAPGQLTITWPDRDQQQTSAGRWLQNGMESIQRSNVYLGHSVLGSWNKAAIYSCTYTRNFLWIVDAPEVKPKFENTYQEFTGDAGGGGSK